MNKKFSTLMACAMLAGSMSAYSQTSHGVTGKWGNPSETRYRTQNTAVTALGASVERNTAVSDYQAVRTDAFDVYSTVNKFNNKAVNKINPEHYYQLEVGENEVLVQLRDYQTGELYLKVVPVNKLTSQYATATSSNPTLNSSLWKISVITTTEGSRMFRFENKETGYYLTYNCAEANTIGLSDVLNGKLQGGKASLETEIIKSDVREWRWYTQDDISGSSSTFSNAPLYTFNHDRDEFIGLALNANNEVVLVKIPANQIGNGNDAMINTWGILNVTVRNAGARTLTANDINSMIDADGSYQNEAGATQNVFAKFKATNGFENNDLFSGEYVALNTEISGYKNSEYTSSAYAGYSIVLNKKGTDKYFMVATDARYENVNPTEHGGLKVYDEEAPANLIKGTMTALKARYHWKVTYYPTQDSLVMEPLNASMVGTEDYKAGIKWADTQLATADPEYYYNTINQAKAHVAGSAAPTTSVPFNKKAYIPVALTLMNGTDDIDNNTVLTVGQSLNTAIGNKIFAQGGTSAKYGLPMPTDNVAEMGIKIQFKHTYTPMTRATVEEDGLYFIKVAVKGEGKRSDYRKDGDYLVMNMWGQLMYDRPDDYQNYLHMPATQWVIEKDTCEVGSVLNNGLEQTPYVTIRNREYGSETNKAFYGQLYKTADGRYYIINHKDYNVKSDNQGKFKENIFSCGDTLYIEQITDKAITGNAYLGYKNFKTDDLNYETWAIQYSTAETYQGLNNDKFLAITEDAHLAVQEDKAKDFEFSQVEEVGYGWTTDGLASLKRKSYVMKVRDNNLIDNEWNYLVVKEDANGNPYYQREHLKNVDGKNILLAKFYFKADQLTADGDTAYVPVQILGWQDMTRPATGWTGWDAGAAPILGAVQTVANSANAYDYVLYPNRTYLANGFKQLGIKTQTTKATYVTLDTDPETVNDAFVFVKEDRPLYMPIGKDVTSGEMNSTIQLFRTRGNSDFNLATEFFYEDGNNQSNVAESANAPISFLGVTAEGVKPVGKDVNTEFYADSVISSNPRMPQYLFFVDNDSIKDGRWCSTNKHGYFPSEEIADDEDATHHVFYNGYNAGRVLVNLNDSVFRTNTNIDLDTEAAKYAFRNYTRLGFVEGIHMNVTAAEAADEDAAFHFLNDGQPGEYLLILKGGLTLKDLASKWNVLDPVKVKQAIEDDKIDVNVLDGKHQNYAFSLRYTDDDHKDVLLESKGRKDASSYYDGAIGTFNEASWLKVLNGVPVLAQPYNYNGDHTQIGTSSSLQEVVNQSEILGLVKGATGEATANENIAAGNVVVAGVNGAVVVKGAEGKNVIVSTILGKVVANEVVSSDNATIAAPAGVVVVSVDGESFKVVVK